MFWLVIIVGAVVFVVIVILRFLDYARRATLALEKLAGRAPITLIQPPPQDLRFP